MIEKIYIIVFLVLYFLIVFVLPSIRVKRKTGINPYVFKNTDSAEDFLGKVSIPLTSLIFAMAVANAVYPGVLQYLAPFTWLQISFVKNAGLVFIHLAFLWILISQVHMGYSWRVGIDRHTKTELVTSGLFSISRNPVFLGMLVTLAGIFMIIPNAVSLLVLVLSVFLFQIQVRIEEDYLRNAFGNAYYKYCQKVNRWL